jgi:hypothetical protein
MENFKADKVNNTIKTFADLVLEGELNPTDFRKWRDMMASKDIWFYDYLGFPDHVYDKWFEDSVGSGRERTDAIEKYFKHLKTRTATQVLIRQAQALIRKAIIKTS